jgi:hypothetical protein
MHTGKHASTSNKNVGTVMFQMKGTHLLLTQMPNDRVIDFLHIISTDAINYIHKLDTKS